MDMSKKICLIFTVILLTSMILTYSVTYRVYAQTIETTVNGLMEQAAETMVTALDDRACKAYYNLTALFD